MMERHARWRGSWKGKGEGAVITGDAFYNVKKWVISYAHCRFNNTLTSWLLTSIVFLANIYCGIDKSESINVNVSILLSFCNFMQQIFITNYFMDFTLSQK